MTTGWKAGGLSPSGLRPYLGEVLRASGRAVRAGMLRRKNLFYSILFCFVLFYSILFCSILFYSVLFYSIQFYSIQFNSILFCSRVPLASPLNAQGAAPHKAGVHTKLGV
jgi:hypothetical protein